MRNHFLIIMLAGILAACSQNSGTKRGENAFENDIGKQALALAENYAKSQLKEAQKIVSANGTVTLADKQSMFVIEPRKIFTGPVDEDTTKDVIASVAAFQGQNQEMTRHLILINTNGRLVLTRIIDSDMEILWIKNGVITAEVPTHPRSSPLFNCSECRDVVNFQFRGGELVKTE
jgi:hypothetical protein